MADITLTYKGSTILSLEDSATKTIKTGGKFCEGDIDVSYVKPSGGGGEDILDAFLTGAISSIENSRITTIRNDAFHACSNLTSVSFPVCTTIGESAFGSCSRLTSVSFPACTTIGSNAFYSCPSLTSVSFPACTTMCNYAFYSCSKLTSVSFPVCKSIDYSAFGSCSNLTSVSFPACTTIGYGAFNCCFKLTSVSFPACKSISIYAFRSCYKLRSLYLYNSVIASLSSINAFTSTPISNYTTSTNGVYGSIFVKSSLLTSWKTATNWATYSSRFVGNG